MIPNRPPSIRMLFGTLLALVMLLAAGLFSVTILQRDTAGQRTDAERQRVTSFRLSDQMRQSSNDLTRMVRLYVTTGDPRYRRYYDEILAIRRGIAPRPVDYNSSFWDRVLANGESGIRTGPPVSLPELMRRAHFAGAEFTALNASLRASDYLAQLERRVMDAVAPRIAAGVDRSYLGAVEPEYRLLVDPAYHREKGRIMAAIERFTQLVDARTSAHEAALQTRTQRLLVSQTGILVLLGITLVVTLAVAARMIAAPLARLTAVTRRIAGGDWSDRAPAAGVAELRQLAADFNGMADAIEHDLVGRRRAEREAREASDRLRTIADRVPGAVFQFHVDPDGGLSVRFASRDGSVHGVADNQGVDFPSVARVVDADDRGAWLDSMVAAARAGGPWRHEYRVHTRPGELAWMQAQALGLPAGDGSGDLYGYVADVTDRKLLEDELRHAREAAETADRAKSAFLAMMSHELRTPLVAVTGTLEILALGDLDPDQRELVEVANRSARALLGVIGDVLDFSKIEAGHLDLAPTPTSVGALVEDVVAQYRLMAPGGQVALRATVDPRLADRHDVDPVRLRQVLGNLVGNAVKFTDVGSVEVRVEVDGEAGGPTQRVWLVIEDTGIGVSAEDQARLFAPFEQARPVSAHPAGGTGLGLVISRQLVEAMGGRVEMSSVLGRGTTMRVELPLAVAAPVAAVADADPATAARRPLPSRAEAERDGSLVLLVEDHPVNREVLVRQLEAIGFATDPAADADEALARFAGARYGLVFTDIQLPGDDGYELARRLRRLEDRTGRPPVPVVALTASALRGERDRCTRAGMQDLVVKPATLATLAQTLRRWLPESAWPAPAPACPPAQPSPPESAEAQTQRIQVEPAGLARGMGFDPSAPDDVSGSSPDAGRAPGIDPAIDMSALDELTGGDRALGRDIVTRYLESLGDELDALGRALRAGDVTGLRRHAHRIAGASRTVGAHAVAAEAARLEEAADGVEESAALAPLAAALRQTAVG